MTDTCQRNKNTEKPIPPLPKKSRKPKKRRKLGDPVVPKFFANMIVK